MNQGLFFDTINIVYKGGCMKRIIQLITLILVINFIPFVKANNISSVSMDVYIDDNEMLILQKYGMLNYQVEQRDISLIII